MRHSAWWACVLSACAIGCGTTGSMVADTAEADALISRATTAYYRGDYPAAKSNFTRARRLYERYDDQEGAAYAWNNLGSVALRQRNYADAELYFARARAVFESIEHESGIAIAANNQGTALRYAGRMEDARAAHQSAISLAEETGDLVVQAAAHSGVGLILMENAIGDASGLTEAEHRFTLALALQEKADDALGKAATLGNLGALAALRGDVPLAIARYTAAHEIDRELENVGGTAQDLIALAELYLRDKQFALAVEFAERALRVDEEIRDDVGAVRARALIDAVAAARLTAEVAPSPAADSP